MNIKTKKILQAIAWATIGLVVSVYMTGQYDIPRVNYSNYLGGLDLVFYMVFQLFGVGFLLALFYLFGILTEWLRVKDQCGTGSEIE